MREKELQKRCIDSQRLRIPRSRTSSPRLCEKPLKIEVRQERRNVPVSFGHANRLADRPVCMPRRITVGVFDAKTHLNRLLEKVSKGETIRITRRGVPIAKLVPADAGEKENPGQVVQEIRALRKGATLGKIKIRELINAGRHY